MFIAPDNIVYLDHTLHAYAFPNHWHAKPLFKEEGFIQIGKHSTRPCILLSVDFT